jgi:hypothetical protein
MKSWILGLTALLLLFNLEAKASVLVDWSSVPPNEKELNLVSGSAPNGTYDTDNLFSGAKVTVAGSGFVQSGLHTPKVDDKGSPFTQPVLSTTADFKANPATGAVTFTINFTQPVRDASFTLFDVDATPDSQHRDADVVTFATTAGLHLTPHADNVVGPDNVVTGIGRTDKNATDEPAGDVNVQYGPLPLKQIVFTWTRPDTAPGENLDEIAIGNIAGIITPVPEVGQLAIGLVACLLGALWLHKNRRKGLILSPKSR